MIPQSHPTPIGHIAIGVPKLEVSKKFYTAVLAPLGLNLVYETPSQPSSSSSSSSPSGATSPPSSTQTTQTDTISLSSLPTTTTTSTATSRPRTLIYGPSGSHKILTIFEVLQDARAPGKGTHIAFNALSRAAVERFHEAALENGGRDDGDAPAGPGPGWLHFEEVMEEEDEDCFAACVVDPDGWRLEAVWKAVE